MPVVMKDACGDEGEEDYRKIRKTAFQGSLS
jgi:hypothetical protein